MQIKKCAYLPLNSNSVNYLRLKKFSLHRGFNDICNDISYLDEILPSSIIFSDDVTLRDKHKILKHILERRIKAVEFISLEVYSLGYEAMVQEHISHITLPFKNLHNIKDLFRSFYNVVRISYATFRALYDITITRTILNLTQSTVFVSSDLRRDYIKNKINSKIPIKIMKNLPIENNWKRVKNDRFIGLYNISPQKEYLFLPGNVNNLEDFSKVCVFADLNNLKIIASSRLTLPEHIIKKFNGLILETGPLAHEHIVSLSYNCFAGVVLYNNNTVNQKISASVKFLEFIYINKPVIVSRNEGVLNEANLYSAQVFIVDELKNNTLLESFQEENNNSISFEQYLNQDFIEDL
jgi:hypothetical protein